MPCAMSIRLTFVGCTSRQREILRDVPPVSRWGMYGVQREDFEGCPLSHACGMSRSVAAGEMFGYSFCDHAEPPYPQHVMSTSRTA